MKGKKLQPVVLVVKNVRKSKKYVPQEGHRSFWYNESNRHFSKAAWSMEQSL